MMTSTRRTTLAGSISAVILAVAFCSLPLAASATGGMAEPATETAGSPNVARAVITRNVVDREPIDEVASLRNDESRLYFFTDLRNLEGTKVIHRWTRDATVMAEVTFEVRGPRWRVWSTKNLEPSWTGIWKVSVVDAEGSVLESRQFTFEKVGGQGAAPAQPGTP